MSTATIWLVIKAVAMLIPVIVNAIQAGKIKTATEQEIYDALAQANDARVARGIAARDGPDDGMPDGFDRDKSGS